MKPIEKMREAVLAECERLCPDTYKPYIDDDGCISIWRKLKWNLEPCFEITVDNETTVIGVDATNWRLFYRLLGLSERDAVAEKDARIQQLKDELLRLTSEQEANCEQYVNTLTEDADYGLNKYISALEAKNDALVKELVNWYMIHSSWWPNVTKGGENIAKVLDAHFGNQSWNPRLAANEKGGANENNLTNVSGFRSFNIGDVVYHRSVYEGNKPFKVVGITEDKLLLEGDFSGGTHSVLQRSWLPIEGSSKKKGGVQG